MTPPADPNPDVEQPTNAPDFDRVEVEHIRQLQGEVRRALHITFVASAVCLLMGAVCLYAARGTVTPA